MSERRPVVPSLVGGETSGEVGITRYVRSGDGHVAFQVLSGGSTDILVVNESVLPMEALLDNAHTAAYLGRLAEWGRVIVFDRRGVGLSDAVARPERLSLLDWVADAVAVLDAVGSERTAVFSSGPSSGLIALQLAADAPWAGLVPQRVRRHRPVPVGTRLPVGRDSRGRRRDRRSHAPDVGDVALRRSSRSLRGDGGAPSGVRRVGDHLVPAWGRPDHQRGPGPGAADQRHPCVLGRRSPVRRWSSTTPTWRTAATSPTTSPTPATSSSTIRATCCSRPSWTRCWP